jgi:hypothetical protein
VQLKTGTDRYFRLDLATKSNHHCPSPSRPSGSERQSGGFSKEDYLVLFLRLCRVDGRLNSWVIVCDDPLLKQGHKAPKMLLEDCASMIKDTTE